LQRKNSIISKEFRKDDDVNNEDSSNKDLIAKSENKCDKVIMHDSKSLINGRGKI